MRVWLLALAACYRDATSATPTPNPVDAGKPPAPKVESPDARDGYVWVAGRWARSGDHYVWLDGYFDHTRPGYRWEQGRWVRVAAPPPEPLAVQWASTVRGFSSQYSNDDWSARRALGPPDVFPAVGDQPNAWASQLPDAPTEFIEVGFATPQHTSAVQIYETFNPGAISHVELIGEHGTTPIAVNATSDQPFVLQISCTAENIVAVRITLDSASVPGWNEIDAIGLVACP